MLWFLLFLLLLVPMIGFALLNDIADGAPWLLLIAGLWFTRRLVRDIQDGVHEAPVFGFIHVMFFAISILFFLGVGGFLTAAQITSPDNVGIAQLICSETDLRYNSSTSSKVKVWLYIPPFTRLRAVYSGRIDTYIVDIDGELHEAILQNGGVGDAYIGQLVPVPSAIHMHGVKYTDGRVITCDEVADR